MKLVFLALVLALASSGCHRSEDPRPHARAIEPGPSLYPMRLSLRDQHGASVGLDAQRGHPVIVSMFYGSCPTACPLIISNIQRIESALPAGVRDDTRVLLVSFDAERDTPAALTAIGQMHRVDPTRWTFATGSDDDVRQLAGVLGVQFRKLPDNAGFAHNSVITVLDDEGRPVARTDDPNAAIEPLVTAVVEVSSKHRS